MSLTSRDCDYDGEGGDDDDDDDCDGDIGNKDDVGLLLLHSLYIFLFIYFS